MDLYVTLNVATFKNIRFIPIICKYAFHFYPWIRKNNQGHIIFDLTSLLGNGVNNEVGK
jgi:hypothetical protein